MPDRIKLNECSVNRTTDNSDNNNADFEINNHQNGVSNAEMENGSVNSNNNNNNNNESDFETEEFSKLRCSSESNEELSERQRRRAARASNGYPGLDFASSIFSSGTIMKFRVISNELHNIQNVQLKRVSKKQLKNNRNILLTYLQHHNFPFNLNKIFIILSEILSSRWLINKLFTNDN